MNAEKHGGETTRKILAPTWQQRSQPKLGRRKDESFPHIFTIDMMARTCHLLVEHYEM